jgi:flavin reductase (DIM6/NTAB) family NADH-FMN oxidoreductase RutF
VTGELRADVVNHDGMADSADAFEDLVTLLDYPMYVVTAASGDQVSGCLVGFASQTSIKPPRFLVGLSKNNRTFRVARHATHLGVHLVASEHLALAELFGGRTGDDTDKFAQCDWFKGPYDVPILADAAGWFVGSVCDRFILGDHVGHLLEPVAGQPPGDLERWVTFADVRDLEPGHKA